MDVYLTSLMMVCFELLTQVVAYRKMVLPNSITR